VRVSHTYGGEAVPHLHLPVEVLEVLLDRARRARQVPADRGDGESPAQEREHGRLAGGEREAPGEVRLEPNGQPCLPLQQHQQGLQLSRKHHLVVGEVPTTAGDLEDRVAPVGHLDRYGQLLGHLMAEGLAREGHCPSAGHGLGDPSDGHRSG
jgi:hypothetical protein